MKKLHCHFFGVFGGLSSYLESRMSDCSVRIQERELGSLDELDPKIEVLGVFVGSRVDVAVLDRLPNLKLIVTLSTGYDHIDLAAAAARGVTVCNVPTYGENTVAEHAMALLLALSRKLFLSIERVKHGQFDYKDLCGFDLKGKTVGVIGTGHIGQHMIRMAKGFDMQVIAYDAFPNATAATTLGYSYVTLEALFKEADIISLHVPLFKETTHLIDKEAISQMKKGVYIVNTARGALIDTEALLSGLEEGVIGGAGLDVLEHEETLQHPASMLYTEGKEAVTVLRTNVMNRLLIEHPRVIVTPHNAFNSTEALQRIIDVTIENILAFQKGNAQNTVTLHE